ncbi:MAG: cytochrome c oxidase assembly protein [Burkholderiales bacterium]
MMRYVWFALALAVLAVCWLGPFPGLARHSFAAHMAMHIAVVAVAAPLLALAVAGGRADPVIPIPDVMAPIPASMIELVVVWAWHVPALHHAARAGLGAFALEQASFVLAGTLLWLAAIGGRGEQRRMRAGGGIVALLFTSMHMTLLGALFALAGRPLFHEGTPSSAAGALADQQLGGVIMLLVGGAAYLAGGLALTARALRSGIRSSAREQEPAL